ncbi:MAG: ABC transporter substrate-binding protein [Chloroflexota bacterium]
MEQETRSLTDLLRSGAISRRDFIARAGALGLSMGAIQTLLAACSSPTPAQPTTAPATAAPAASGSTPAPAAAGTPKRGGMLVQARNWTIPTMDPHLTSLPDYILYYNMYETLVGFELVDAKTWEHKVVGVLAESWEQKDPSTLVFKLRQGVVFHDGSPFDAEVAKWNFERARDHPKSGRKSSLTAIDKVTAVDKYTLEIKTKTPNAALLRMLPFNGPFVGMMSKAAFDKNGEDWCQRNGVGTGPFKQRQWITDDRLIMDKHTEYWRKGADGKPLPYLDGVTLRYVPDPTVAFTDMKAGGVHLLEWPLPKDVPTIKADPNLVADELPWAGQIYFKVGYNTEKPPFNDVRVRQAVNYGIDRAGMHKALGFGLGAPHYYPFWAPGTLGYDEKMLKYEYNPAKVKELLTQAGYPNGVEIELKVIAREPEQTIGEFVQQMWSAVGIKTKLVAQERLSWIDAVRAKNFQACFWRGSLASIIDPELSRVYVTCGAPSNWAQWCDKEVDKLMNDGLQELDPKKRAEIYKQCWTIIQDRAYGGTGFIAPIVHGYRKSVKGLTRNFEVPLLHATWLDG